MGCSKINMISIVHSSGCKVHSAWINCFVKFLIHNTLEMKCDVELALSQALFSAVRMDCRISAGVEAAQDPPLSRLRLHHQSSNPPHHSNLPHHSILHLLRLMAARTATRQLLQWVAYLKLRSQRSLNTESFSQCPHWKMLYLSGIASTMDVCGCLHVFYEEHLCPIGICSIRHQYSLRPNPSVVNTNSSIISLDIVISFFDRVAWKTTWRFLGNLPLIGICFGCGVQIFRCTNAVRQNPAMFVQFADCDITIYPVSPEYPALVYQLMTSSNYFSSIPKLKYWHCRRSSSNGLSLCVLYMSPCNDVYGIHFWRVLLPK